MFYYRALFSNSKAGEGRGKTERKKIMPMWVGHAQSRSLSCLCYGRRTCPVGKEIFQFCFKFNFHSDLLANAPCYKPIYKCNLHPDIVNYRNYSGSWRYERHSNVISRCFQNGPAYFVTAVS